MIDTERTLRLGTADLTVMRLTTTATLALMILIGGFLQLALGLNGNLDGRMLILTVLTGVSVLLALAVMPLLTKSPGDFGPGHPLMVALLLLTASVWVIAAVSPFAGWSWAFTLAVAGGMLTCLAPGWWRAAAILGTYAVIGVVGAVTSSGSVDTVPGAAGAVPDAIVFGQLALFPVMPLSAVWVLQLVLRLDHARQVSSELAVARERLRFATDLHDIQGHHLQVIALKSELAGRLLGDSPEAAAVEMEDVRAIAQTALEDTRAVVNDYRTVTVAVEVRNAAAVLRSAGIRCDAHIDTKGMPEDVGALFAVAIREAATNILRHSRASEARIEIVWDGTAEYRLAVTNDAPRPAHRGGTGLAGLAERVAVRQGTVESTRSDNKLTLIVRVPAGGKT